MAFPEQDYTSFKSLSLWISHLMLVATLSWSFIDTFNTLIQFLAILYTGFFGLMLVITWFFRWDFWLLVLLQKKEEIQLILLVLVYLVWILVLSLIFFCKERSRFNLILLTVIYFSLDTVFLFLFQRQSPGSTT